MQVDLGDRDAGHRVDAVGNAPLGQQPGEAVHALRPKGEMLEAEIIARVGRCRLADEMDHGPVAEVVTAEKLSALYETPARVVEVEGRRVVLWE